MVLAKGYARKTKILWSNQLYIKMLELSGEGLIIVSNTQETNILHSQWV